MRLSWLLSFLNRVWEASQVSIIFCARPPPPANTSFGLPDKDTQSSSSCHRKRKRSVGAGERQTSEGPRLLGPAPGQDAKGRPEQKLSAESKSRAGEQRVGCRNGGWCWEYRQRTRMHARAHTLVGGATSVSLSIHIGKLCVCGYGVCACVCGVCTRGHVKASGQPWLSFSITLHLTFFFLNAHSCSDCMRESGTLDLWKNSSAPYCWAISPVHPTAISFCIWCSRLFWLFNSLIQLSVSFSSVIIVTELFSFLFQ